MRSGYCTFNVASLGNIQDFAAKKHMEKLGARVRIKYKRWKGERERESWRARTQALRFARTLVCCSHPREIMGTVRSPFLPTRPRGRTHCSPIDDREIRKALLAIDYVTPFFPRVVEQLVCRSRLSMRAKNQLDETIFRSILLLCFVYRFRPTVP